MFGEAVNVFFSWPPGEVGLLRNPAWFFSHWELQVLMDEEKLKPKLIFYLFSRLFYTKRHMGPTVSN